MNVLVTGSSGQLGTEIIKHLQRRKINHVGVDLIPSPTTHNIADIRNRKEISKLIRSSDHVIHTAAMHGKHTLQNVPREEFIETNIKGTLHLLEGAVEAKVKSFVFTSTTSVYGAAMIHPAQAVWVDEELTPAPRDIYDITKLAAENLCRDFFDKEKLNCCALRISRFLDEPPNTKANHRLYRGLDGADGAEAHWLALTKKFKKFEVFNISNKSPFKKEDLKRLKTNPRAVIEKYHPESAMLYQERNWSFPNSIDRVYSIDKATRFLKFNPKKNFMELLQEAVAMGYKDGEVIKERIDHLKQLEE